MPELPEVETARRTLESLVVGRRITGLDVLRPQVLRSHGHAEGAQILTGRTIEALGRRGKALLFGLSDGWTLAFHFSLWGTILVQPHSVPDPVTAAVIALDDGRSIVFRELQLSNLNLYRTAEIGRAPYLGTLGADPLDPAVTRARFREALSGRGAIRNLLTDQTRLAGIGNLWALEILFAARLRPNRKAQALQAEAWGRLYRATRSVLRRAIRAGGEPEFIDAAGRKGRFRLAVYGRGGQPCRVCGTPIVAGKVGGRPAFYCRRCQR